jgi:hypothetical protein
MKNKILIASGVAALLAMASSAYATSSIGIEVAFNGGSFLPAQTLNDNAVATVSGPPTVPPIVWVGDQDATVGSIAALYSFGGLTAELVFGGPGSSGSTAPFLNLVINGTLQAGQSVKVIFSAAGFSQPLNGHVVLSDTENAGGPSATYSFAGSAATSGTGGALFDMRNPMVTDTTLTAFGVTSKSAVLPGSTSNPYSITIEADLVNTGTTAANLSATAVLTTVPDGGNTLMLLGSALSILGIGAFRRKAAKA